MISSHEFPAWLCRHLALELQKFPCHAPAQRRFGGTLQRQQPGRDKNEEFNGAFDPPKYGNHRFTSPNMWYYVIKQPMIKGFSWIYIIFYNCGFLKSWVPKSHGFQWCPSWSSHDDWMIWRYPPWLRKPPYVLIHPQVQSLYRPGAPQLCLFIYSPHCHCL